MSTALLIVLVLALTFLLPLVLRDQVRFWFGYTRLLTRAVKRLPRPWEEEDRMMAELRQRVMQLQAQSEDVDHGTRSS